MRPRNLQTLVDRDRLPMSPAPDRGTLDAQRRRELRITRDSQRFLHPINDVLCAHAAFSVSDFSVADFCCKTQAVRLLFFIMQRQLFKTGYGDMDHKASLRGMSFPLPLQNSAPLEPDQARVTRLLPQPALRGPEPWHLETRHRMN